MGYDMGNAFPSKWIKVADITKPVQVVIDRLAKEVIQNQEKYVLYFRGKSKGLILKAAHSNALVQAFGRNSDGWLGRTITIQPGMTTFQGKPVATIFLLPSTAAPAAATAPANAPAGNVGDAADAAFGGDDEGGSDDFDSLGNAVGEDDIPF